GPGEPEYTDPPGASDPPLRRARAKPDRDGSIQARRTAANLKTEYGRLSVSGLALPDRHGPGGALRLAAGARLGSGLPHGGDRDRSGPWSDRQRDEGPAALRGVRRGDDAVPDRAGTGTEDAVVDAREARGSRRAADCGHHRHYHRDGAGAGRKPAGGADGGHNPVAVLDRDRAADPERKEPDALGWRPQRVLGPADAGYRRHP